MPINRPLRDWTGQVVWIVGASSGIGLATAEALARRGAKVVVSARKAAPLEAFAAAHPGAMALPLDAAALAALGSATELAVSVEGKDGVSEGQGPSLPWLFRGHLVDKAL